MRYARRDDGQPRVPMLLLRASEHLRKSLDTACRIQQACMELSQVERFHEAIIQAVAEESPAAAEKILARIGQIATEWGG
jgi:DNA-binding FadR family transcriptional regulator